MLFSKYAGKSGMLFKNKERIKKRVSFIRSLHMF